MNYIIGLLVVVFLGLTIAVIARLQGVLKGVKTEEQSEEPEGNKWNAVVSLVFLILGLIGSIWSYIHAKV
jgi:cytochrome c oxidase subunit 2